MPLEELPLEAETLVDEALALVVDVALAVTELEAEEELDLSETLSPETELGLLVLGTGLLCNLSKSDPFYENISPNFTGI